MQRKGNFRGWQVAIGLALVLCAPLAGAHNRPRVDWSVSIGTPYAAPIYNPPTMVYSQPEIIYTRAQPVYVERVPAMQYRPTYARPYYEEELIFRKRGHHRHHEHHEHRRHHRD